MNKITFIFSLIFSYVLGFTLNKGLSSTNVIREPIENGIEILKHDIPFIYTVRLNEIFLLITATIFFFLSIYYYYSKSETSKYQLFNLLMKVLWIEIIIFIFIMGSWGIKIIEDLKEDSFYLVYEWILVGVLLALIIFLSMLHEYNCLKNKIKEKGIEDLYQSREKLLPLFHSYLEIYKSFSITGDWGIGKSKLIENFFKGAYSYCEDGMKIVYRDRYECIYLDSSSYADNQKMVEALKRELNRNFKEAKIFKLDKNFSNELFNISNNCIELLRKLCIQEENLNDSREILNKKIEEYQNLTNKKLILCLDNLERIGNKERITSLLSIMDEILSDNISRIYIYDEKYMMKLFGEEEFKKYIEKYSESKIEVKEVEIKEIIKKPEEIDLIRLVLRLEIEQNIKEEKNEKIKKNVQLKWKEIEKKLTNPRSLKSIIKYVSNEKIKFSINTKVQYRLLTDLFGEINLNDPVQKIIFFPENTFLYKAKLEEFYALQSGKTELINMRTKEEEKEMEKKALSGDGEDIINYINYCKKNLRENNLDYFFDKLGSYDIKSEGNLKDFINLMYSSMDIKINNLNLKNNKKFFNGKNYSLDKAKYILKVILIRRVFKNFKRASRYLFENYDDFRRLYDNAPITFEEELKKIKKMSLNQFIDKIDEEVRSDEIRYQEIIKLNEFKNEILILKKVDQMIGETENESKINFSEEYIVEYFKSQLYLDSFIEIENDKIVIKLYDKDKKEMINKINIVEYKEFFEKIKGKEDIIMDFYLEILLLEERLNEEKRNN